MDMSNSVVLPSTQARVWEALNDPAILKQCINGCESMEKTGDNQYAVVMTVAIGPVKAKFKGNLRLTDIDPPNSYMLQFDGQGGVAGFGKGAAKVALAPEGDGTRLSYTVNAQIGGKIAQLGSRLVDGASKKMADDFFQAFRVAIAPAEPDSAADAAAMPSGESGAEPSAAASVAAQAPPASAAPSPFGMRRQWRWLLVAAALLAMAIWYVLGRK